MGLLRLKVCKGVFFHSSWLPIYFKSTSYLFRVTITLKFVLEKSLLDSQLFNGLPCVWTHVGHLRESFIVASLVFITVGHHRI